LADPAERFVAFGGEEARPEDLQKEDDQKCAGNILHDPNVPTSEKCPTIQWDN